MFDYYNTVYYGRPASWAVGFSGSPFPCLLAILLSLNKMHLLHFVQCTVTNKYG